MSSFNRTRYDRASNDITLIEASNLISCQRNGLLKFVEDLNRESTQLPPLEFPAVVTIDQWMLPLSMSLISLEAMSWMHGCFFNLRAHINGILAGQEGKHGGSARWADAVQRLEGFRGWPSWRRTRHHPGQEWASRSRPNEPGTDWRSLWYLRVEECDHQNIPQTHAVQVVSSWFGNCCARIVLKRSVRNRIISCRIHFPGHLVTRTLLKSSSRGMI